MGREGHTESLLCNENALDDEERYKKHTSMRKSLGIYISESVQSNRTRAAWRESDTRLEREDIRDILYMYLNVSRSGLEREPLGVGIECCSRNTDQQ